MAFPYPRRTTLITAFTLFGLLLLFRFLIGLGAGAGELPAAEPLPVSALTMRELSSYTVERSFVGRVAARRESEVGFELAGAIAALGFEEGDVVESGAVLARLDTQILEARDRELAAALSDARVREELAESFALRTRAAAEQGAVAPQALDEAEAALRSASAATLAAQAATNSLQVQLEKSALRAPFSASIARRYMDEGQVAAAGTPVYRLLETGTLDARIVVSAEAARDLRLGEPYAVSIRGESMTATLRAIFPEREGATRGVAALFSLADSEGAAVGIGDLAQLTLPKRVDSAVYRLPLTALTESVRGIWAVYAAIPAARAESGAARWTLDRIQVEVMHQSGDGVYVRGGLSDGQLVINTGLQRLVPGQEVRVTRLDEGAAASAEPAR